MTQSDPWLHISIDQQQLCLIKNNKIKQTYAISSALNGSGCLENSGCTPLGLHQIKLKIGADCPINSVFIGRRPTGEIYNQQKAQAEPQRDWILTRILWLSGCQSKMNRGRNVDTLARFIYIHGTPDTEPMGINKSHGCIRMHNTDLIPLFEQTFNKMSVLIEATPCPLF